MAWHDITTHIICPVLNSNFPFGLGFLLATFSLFLGPFLGAKKSPFLTPFAQPNQRENYQFWTTTNTITKLQGFLNNMSHVLCWWMAQMWIERSLRVSTFLCGRAGPSKKFHWWCLWTLETIFGKSRSRRAQILIGFWPNMAKQVRLVGLVCFAKGSDFDRFLAR